VKFLRKSVTVTARYCLLFIVERKYDLRQPEDISGKELSGGILLHTEIPPFYVDEIVIITWYIKAKIYEYGNGMSRKEKNYSE
jgi:hypothetical protein